ncbi:hypothetical protein [Roseomonas populi]|uniref:Uncharacterized protein n=1 Tax=Roseomonas populi TaxID=3121582 RepID=A0ABT1X2W3_9PROT|nr:hypothetical protein [Roseomonas pecuniae]MCR0982447.1 hypothetical protein [Roseomonas pecuniae]
MIATLALSALLLGAPPNGGLPGAGIQLVQDAVPEAAPAPARRRQPRRRPARRRPIAPPQEEALTIPSPSPAPTPRVDIAPMPNRSIEAPRAPTPPETATIRPDLIEPRALPDARTQSGTNNYTERQDRLFRDPAAGARLNIPFSY